MNSKVNLRVIYYIYIYFSLEERERKMWGYINIDIYNFGSKNYFKDSYCVSIAECVIVCELIMCINNNTQIKGKIYLYYKIFIYPYILIKF